MVLINMLYLARVKKKVLNPSLYIAYISRLKNHPFCLSRFIISHFSKQAILNHFCIISVVETTTLWRKRSIKMNKKKIKNKKIKINVTMHEIILGH